MSKNAIYAQSGGVTAVINASACGIIETARKYPDQIGKVYAGRNGIVGILKEDLIDTSEESSESIARLRTAPSGAFGSCRYKLKSIQESRDAYQRLIDVFAAHEIGYFFYNGGGDSADTCLKIAQISEQMGYPVQALHVPKTVDNDLPVTDSSPGFGSAAKYIATSVLEASLDVASMSLTSTKVFILEVMGRHSGWMAAAGGMASSQSHPIPLVILFPEIAFDREQFIQRVRSTVSEHGQVSIVVSEGVAGKDGRFLAGQDGSDAFGHQQLGGVAPTIACIVKQDTGFKYHWAVADYLQRSARHIASRTDVEQAYAVGESAVLMALDGENSVMPAIVRTSDHPYQWKIGKASLAEVANVEKKLPGHFIDESGYGITQACRDYIAPLMEGEDYPEFRNGVPHYIRLVNKSVPRKLDTDFEV
ncbi:MAG: 6-phosphofructokinase [Gammaproteobacteria bacterium]|nr:6-phosphofructokinase [Gammaproteobacteria bacterium]MCY4228827.1 6-phosphofructokinase [Gammaproteobacteria bacterium]